MRESRMLGSVRGALSNGRPYRDPRCPALRPVRRLLCAAYRGGTFTMPQLAAHAELSVSQVSRLIAAGVKLAKRET